MRPALGGIDRYHVDVARQVERAASSRAAKPPSDAGAIRVWQDREPAARIGKRLDGVRLDALDLEPQATEPLLDDDYSATFTTALMEKDIDLVLDAANGVGVELPVTTELKAVLRAAIEAGYGNDDFMALFPFLQSAPDREVVR